MEKTDHQKCDLIYDVAVLAGELMLKSGVEIYRVEDTMYRILSLSSLHQIDIYATPTGIITTLSELNCMPITRVKRITNRTNNLECICSVNEVSRELCNGKITVEDSYEKLIAIQNSKHRSNTIIMLCTVLSVMGFTILFGGGITEFLISGAVSIPMVFLGLLFKKLIINNFVCDLLKGFIISFCTMVMHYLVPSVQADIIIISAIMPLLPGISITNAIRDTLQGDYVSGISRACEAFVVTISIAVGVGAGLGFYNFLAGGI